MDSGFGEKEREQDLKTAHKLDKTSDCDSIAAL